MAILLKGGSGKILHTKGGEVKKLRKAGVSIASGKILQTISRNIYRKYKR